jgi:hypothetical protein
MEIDLSHEEFVFLIQLVVHHGSGIEKAAKTRDSRNTHAYIVHYEAKRCERSTGTGKKIGKGPNPQNGKGPLSHIRAPPPPTLLSSLQRLYFSQRFQFV